MIIDKTIKAAAMFAAEGNIRPTLSGVMVKNKEFLATDSMSACILKAQNDESFDHDAYPEMGIKDLSLEHQFILDAEGIKKLKFYKNKDNEILNDTMQMGTSYDDRKIFFGRTDMYSDSVFGVSRILHNSKFPDIKHFIDEGEKNCQAEVAINVDYLLKVAKAMKEAGSVNIHIGIGKVEQGSASYPVTKSNSTATSPVLFGDEKGNKIIVMPLARQSPIFYKK